MKIKFWVDGIDDIDNKKKRIYGRVYETSKGEIGERGAVW